MGKRMVGSVEVEGNSPKLGVVAGGKLWVGLWRIGVKVFVVR